MMPPSSTTDTARTRSTDRTRYTGVRCARPHTPRRRPTDRVGSASLAHTMSVGAFRPLCFARRIGRGLGEPVALTAAMLRFIGSRPDVVSKTCNRPNRLATEKHRTPKHRGQRPSIAPGRRDLVTRGRSRWPTIRSRLIRLPLPLSLSVDRTDRVAHRGGLPRCGHRRVLRACAGGLLAQDGAPGLAGQTA